MDFVELYEYYGNKANVVGEEKEKKERCAQASHQYDLSSALQVG